MATAPGKLLASICRDRAGAMRARRSLESPTSSGVAVGSACATMGSRRRRTPVRCAMSLRMDDLRGERGTAPGLGPGAWPRAPRRASGLAAQFYDRRPGLARPRGPSRGLPMKAAAARGAAARLRYRAGLRPGRRHEAGTGTHASARVVRPVARAVPVVVGSVVPIRWRIVVRVIAVVREDRSKPEPEAAMKTSVEVVSFEAVVPAEAVTAPGSRLAGHVDRKHDRECGKRDECQFFRMRNPFHGIFTFSFHLWDATALPKIHPPTVLIACIEELCGSASKNPQEPRAETILRSAPSEGCG